MIIKDKAYIFCGTPPIPADVPAQLIADIRHAQCRLCGRDIVFTASNYEQVKKHVNDAVLVCNQCGDQVIRESSVAILTGPWNTARGRFGPW